MEIEQNKLKNVRKAGLYSLIPGLGQFYNKQPFKGVIFIAIFLLFVFQMAIAGIPALTGFITLGTTPRVDHSLFLLIKGSLQIIVILLFLVFYFLNIYDARRVATIWNVKGKANTTAKAILKNAWDSGFPYLLTIPAYLAMTFVIIFPVLVTLFTAFTNYDFYHIPPFKLIDWVGLKNFLNIFSLSSYRETFQVCSAGQSFGHYVPQPVKSCLGY